MTEKKINRKIEIYFGSLIAEPSEQFALKQIIETLNAAKLNAVIIANANFSNRQIDIIVALNDTVLVVEVKGYNRPVRGSKNGNWEYKPSLGDWRSTGRNFYRQTLEAKNALRDSMSKFTGNQEQYPEAALIFVPNVPKGSNIPTSDFKVKIGDIDLLRNFHNHEKGYSWGLGKWRSFAKHHDLINVNELESAFDPQLAKSEQVLESYKEAFIETYAPQVKGLIPFDCLIDGETVTSDVVGNSINDKLILGPSGCGKSLLAKKAGISCLSNNQIPLFLEAKYFQKNFKAFLNQEVALLGASSIIEFFSACKKTGRQLVIILDGFNEASLGLQKRLVRCLRAVSIRQRAYVVVISQKLSMELETLKLSTIQVPVPDLNLKKAIAESVCSEGISTTIDELLELAPNGFEASLIGQLSTEITMEMSRYGIFDIYVRKLLGVNAQEGIKILTQIGGYLSDNITFSLSIREFDRLIEKALLSANISRELFNSALLEQLGDRASFRHELYLCVFAAEAVVRSCNGDVEKILKAISSPKYVNSKTLIVGAIDNTNVLGRVLSGIADEAIVVSCIEGKCGGYACEWAKNKCKNILKNIAEEAQSVEFKVDKNSLYSIGVNKSSLKQWSHQDQAFINALPKLIHRGSFLEEIFEIVALMDANLDASFKRLMDEAREKNIALRSGLFSIGLDDQNSAIAISKVVAWIELQGFSKRGCREETIASWISNKLSVNEITNGQLLMLLKLNHFIRDQEPFASYLSDLIKTRWRYAPYHLRLKLLDTARSCRNYTVEEKSRIIDALENLDVKNIFISTLIVDALKSLGAINDDVYEETVLEEIEQVLSDPENSENRRMAGNLYARQFDHPYDQAYWTVIDALPDEKRKLFLSMAVSEKDSVRMFLGCLIEDLRKFGDQNSGKYIYHWTDLPDSPQQEYIEAFVVAHIVLGQLHFPFPAKEYNFADTDNAMMACGELYYWMNRDDLSKTDRNNACTTAIQVLMDHKLNLSIGIIRDCENSRKHNDLMTGSTEKHSLIDGFPSELRTICRSVLENQSKQKSWSPWASSKEIYQYALNILGSVGTALDLTLLRTYADHSDYGIYAIQAIQSLESKV